MKTYRTVSLGRDTYVLPESFSVEDSLRLLNFLGGCRRISDGDHVPDARSRYATTVNVLSDEHVEVAIKITAAPLMTREDYNDARAKGQALYDAAHPGELKISA